MPDTVIKVENISKKYLIRHEKQERYTTLRDAISNTSKSLAKKFTGESIQSSSDEEFWALQDVSFSIDRGDRIGIIGRNGAGKSTLLKILSRITEPSAGSIRLKGRVASLLEVGTGFHPELTGRENISLNGAILGMSRTDIKQKFDEIVTFAEVEKFLDTPVKRYSSGMYVRLAFAVAAHLEPEILIVDEVLAVGDAQFQKKCLGKMEEVGKSGRTVLFVSHNMSTIQSLCTRCIFLQKGKVLADDSTSAVIPLYLNDASASDSFTRPAQDNERPTIVSGKIVQSLQLEVQEIQIDLEIFADIPQAVALDFRLHDIMGGAIGFGDFGTTRSSQSIDLEAGINLVSFMVPIDKLAIGSYVISLELALPWIEYLDRVENCLCFEVTRPPLEEGGSVLSQAWGFGSVEFPLERIR
jgi:lipopolysaccharide transport system ATP-binding protein